IGVGQVLCGQQILLRSVLDGSLASYPHRRCPLGLSPHELSIEGTPHHNFRSDVPCIPPTTWSVCAHRWPQHRRGSRSFSLEEEYYHWRASAVGPRCVQIAVPRHAATSLPLGRGVTSSARASCKWHPAERSHRLLSFRPGPSAWFAL